MNFSANISKPILHCRTQSFVFHIEDRYDFLTLSNHINVTDVKDDDLTLIPGIEWNNAKGKHTGIYSLDKQLLRSTIQFDDHEKLLEYLCDKDALVVLNHPDWGLDPHYSRTELVAKPFLHGIEVYNGVIEVLKGGPNSSVKWDYLLSNGKKVLGFASDDFHLTSNLGKGWICVRSSNNDASSILTAIKAGNFYCSTGVDITNIKRNDDFF